MMANNLCYLEQGCLNCLRLILTEGLFC